MQELKPVKPLTPKSIGDNKFRIPLYQRLFEWEDEQLLGLLEDMKNHFGKTEVKPYYIGMMTGCRPERFENGKVIDLVDGQQRFTTIMLMGIAMNRYHEEWKRFITEDRLTFTAREDDKKYLRHLIGISNQRPEKEKVFFEQDASIKVNLKMQKALRTILTFLNKFETPDEKRTYSKDVYERLTFFVTTLPGVYVKSPIKLNKYFETMNSAGRSLEQHEKIKVDLLRKCPDTHAENKSQFNSIWNAVERMDMRLLCKDNDGVELNVIDEEIDKVCNSQLSNLSIKGCDDIENGMEIKNILPTNEEPALHENRKDVGSVIDFQELLLLSLNFTLGTEDKPKPLDKHKLEESFKDFPEEKIPYFYLNLYKIRLLLDRYVIRVEKENGRNLYRIRLSEDEKPTEEERKLVQYQSMLYVSTSAHLWLTPYLKWLMTYDNRKSLDAGLLLHKLKEIDNKLHELCPLNKMYYDKGVDRYWFWRLDYYLWERRKEYYPKEEQQEIVEKYVFRANRSIEHLHPQNQSKNTEWDDNDVNSFGNLALISSSFNSQQGNDPVLVKFARVENQARNNDLESLKMYKMYLDSKHIPEGWTNTTRDNHQKEMYDLLEKSYQS